MPTDERELTGAELAAREGCWMPPVNRSTHVWLVRDRTWAAASAFHEARAVAAEAERDALKGALIDLMNALADYRQIQLGPSPSVTAGVQWWTRTVWLVRLSGVSKQDS